MTLVSDRYGFPIYQYGLDHKGDPIVPPPGWRLLCEGEPIPTAHREFTRNGDNWSGWCEPRRCHSTMTPLRAEKSGWVLGFAVPLTETTT